MASPWRRSVTCPERRSTINRLSRNELGNNDISSSCSVHGNVSLGGKKKNYRGPRGRCSADIFGVSRQTVNEITIKRRKPSEWIRRHARPLAAAETRRGPGGICFFVPMTDDRVRFRLLYTVATIPISNYYLFCCWTNTLHRSNLLNLSSEYNPSLENSGRYRLLRSGRSFKKVSGAIESSHSIVFSIAVVSIHFLNI